MNTKIKGSSYLIGKNLIDVPETEMSDEELTELEEYIEVDGISIEDNVYFYEARGPYNTVKRRDELINLLMKHSTVFNVILHDYMEIMLDQDSCISEITKFSIIKFCDMKHTVYFSNYGCIVHVSDAIKLKKIFGKLISL